MSLYLPKAAATPKPIPRIALPTWHNATQLVQLGLLVIIACIALAVAGPAVMRLAGPPESQFARIGRSYRTELDEVYARAWDDGAAALEAGAGRKAALDHVVQAWKAGRVDLFERAAAKKMDAIVPESKGDKEITAAENRKLAEAWRGFARGLRGGR